MNTENRKQKIKDLIVNRLNLRHDPQSIGDDVMLFEPEEEKGLGLDSVDALELAVAINNEFDITISDDDMGIFQSVNSINEFIEGQLQLS
ncbi:MAG: phosphopantetheine-binding protein [Gilvibacter sp.]